MKGHVVIRKVIFFFSKILPGANPRRFIRTPKFFFKSWKTKNV